MDDCCSGSNPSGRTVEAVVEEIARKAGELALVHFRSLSSLPVEKKGHLDLVTKADKDVEEFLIARLRQAFPTDGIFGEEGGEIMGTSGRTWVIDPIDGTFNFVRGGPNWAVSIGLYENRRPVFGVIHAPVRDLTLTGGTSVETRLDGKPMRALPALDLSQASIGIGLHPSVATDDRLELMRFISDELRISFRCCGSATLSLIEVAMGETDGYVSLGDSTWDVMAALPILANLGVSHTIDWDRIDLRAKLRFACGSDVFLKKVRPLLEKVAVAA
ncbi:inositol monophosphatase family protein [Rhizobium puerariae]|uniref:Inositol monophosphatase family protein n=1 Tax=Rhizobium puerariae TaxID=1585791 RepID=A0ABV6ARJ8_9HYPH